MPAKRFEQFTLDELKILKSSLDMGDAMDTKKAFAVRKRLLKELERSFQRETSIAALNKKYKVNGKKTSIIDEVMRGQNKA